MAILKIKVQPGASRNEIGGMWLDMDKLGIKPNLSMGLHPSGASLSPLKGNSVFPLTTPRGIGISRLKFLYLKIKVTAPPERGKANKACIELLSKELGIPKSSIQLIRGETSREKQLQIEGLSALQLTNKLKKYTKTS